MLLQRLAFSTSNARIIRQASRSLSSVGYKIPSDIVLHRGFPPQEINLAEYVSGRNVVLVGLPGAFTPT